MIVHTRRLSLVPSTAELARGELRGPAALGELLGVHVPEVWPPDLYDEGAIGYWLSLLENDPSSAGWCAYYFVLRDASPRATLIGAGGYKGKPDIEGTVEIGYSILAAYRRRGFASEAAGGLVANAFEDGRVTRVIAETLPELGASIGVLEKNGFRLIGDGSEPGVIRFELRRREYVPAAAAPNATS
ncbi:MAG: GNAT family N-acetyltransferase [Gemmatimonadaceae bacterium]